MEAFDVTVEIILHLEQAIAVWTFEHIRQVQLLMNRSHVIPHRMKTCEAFEAKIALSKAVEYAKIEINAF